ncbi:MAG TPA: GNAT family N-acetyltransferase [Candidatus Eisenbacteria bacterium]|nr:GNAT family N-acetyltransferase [Candidatus Eisenbacteria bacterium]
MSDRSDRRNLLARAWSAARDHARHAPLRIQERIVYSRSLDSPIRFEPPRTPASFIFDPPLAHEAAPGPPVVDHVYRAVIEGREAYRMRVSLDRDSTAHLVPERDLPPRVVFFYDCLTHSEFRGRGLYPAALTSAMETLRPLGYRRAYIRVHRENQASIAGIEKAGFERCGLIVHVALFGFRVGPWRRPGRASANGAGSRP